MRRLARPTEHGGVRDGEQMSRYFFAGHEGLSNRGCEALLRGIVTAVRRFDSAADFLAPSFDGSVDAMRWPEADAERIRFVPAYRLPVSVRLWARLQGRWPAVRRLGLPRPGLPRSLDSPTAGVRHCVLTGGDVLSLDYGVAPLIRYLGQARYFIDRGVPVSLWAASVGPFNGMPDVERQVVRDLHRFADISVRESATLAYLHGLGLTRARLVADPAFLMAPQGWDPVPVLPPQRDDGLLGFNVSPLVYKLARLRGNAAGQTLEDGVVGFLRHVVASTRLGVVLVPHVDSVDGSAGKSDFAYMHALLTSSGLDTRRVALAPREMNAAQVKYLISTCTYFVGARTHSTIAAWSSHVPTLSLGYSVKARGLNRDLFGDERYVIDSQQLDLSGLCSAFERLQADAAQLRRLLRQRIPLWQQRAFDAMPVEWRIEST
jgi:polysaccharide pyruvyl transferase WcaK-like protein